MNLNDKTKKKVVAYYSVTNHRSLLTMNPGTLYPLHIGCDAHFVCYFKTRTHQYMYTYMYV